MPRQPQLSRTEWLTVSIALKDASDCGCAVPSQPGSVRARLQAVGRVLFGSEPKRPMADPRLETLRRFVCETRRARRPADKYSADLAQHGFSQAQIEALALLSA